MGTLLEDLDSNRYAQKEIWVIDDRSADTTAAVAESKGVNVARRADGPEGKGAALAWFLDQHPLSNGESLVVFDADNRIPTDTLQRIAEELDSGHQVVQCYLDVANPDDSLLAEASALSYWAGNRMVQLARANLGWSADLSGTGMAITKEALEAAGGFGDSLTEDQELGVRLLLAGHRVEWLHDVRIKDEKPSTVRVAVRQRARWMAGKRSVRRKHTLALLRSSSPAGIDMAIRLWQPGRSFVALVSGLMTVLSATIGATWLLPWPVWAAATAIQVLEPIPFLAKDGVAPRRLVRYPVLALLAALWIPIRLGSGRVRGWYHTPHQGESAEMTNRVRPTEEPEDGTEPIRDVHDAGGSDN